MQALLSELIDWSKLWTLEWWTIYIELTDCMESAAINRVNGFPCTADVIDWEAAADAVPTLWYLTS